MDNVYRMDTEKGMLFITEAPGWMITPCWLDSCSPTPISRKQKSGVEISGDILKVHAQEMVFDTYVYDVQGTISTSSRYHHACCHSRSSAGACHTHTRARQASDVAPAYAGSSGAARRTGNR